MRKHDCQERESISSLLHQSAQGIAAGFLIATLALVSLLFSGLDLEVEAQEIILLEQPFPSSVEDDVTPIEVAFIEYAFPTPMFPSLKQQLKDAPAFFRDTQLDFNTRSY
jgi:hypothetical protein